MCPTIAGGIGVRFCSLMRQWLDELGFPTRVILLIAVVAITIAVIVMAFH
jgi:hypothetical protein